MIDEPLCHTVIAQELNFNPVCLYRCSSTAYNHVTSNVLQVNLASYEKAFVTSEMTFNENG